MSTVQTTPLSPAELQFALDGPALAPPSGVMPNFNSPPHNDRLAHGVLAICTVLSSFAIILRCYSSIFCVKKIALQDCLAVVAYGFFMGYIGITYWLMNVSGFFVHQWNIKLRDFVTVLYIIHIGTNLYTICVIGVKSAILLEWIRIFNPHGVRNLFYWTCVSLLSANVVYYIGTAIAEHFSCIPYEKLWNRLLPGACYDWRPVNLSAAVVNIASDIIILCAPQRVIWNLRLSRKRKLGVSVVFLVGIIACVAAIVRLVQTIGYQHSDDTTYALSSLTLAAIAEMTCGFLVFCMPSAPSAFKGTMVMTRLSTALRSWVHWTAKQSRQDETSTWPHDTLQTSGRNSSYKRIGEDRGPLTDIAAGRPSDSAAMGQLEDGNAQTGIIRMTTFTVKDTYEENNAQRGQSNQQHPWTSSS